MKPWLIMLCPYFGEWPAWMNFFIESCKWNPDVRWRFYTDCGEPENRAKNVDYMHIAFDDYKTLVRDRLAVAFDPNDPYKLCDLKPSLGFLHERDIIDYPFFGYGDIDVIYGRLCEFYNPFKLADFDVISTHPDWMSGHFAVLRNTFHLRRAFELIPNYREALNTPRYMEVDESKFGEILRELTKDRSIFVERYSTVLSPRGWHDGTMNYPQRWFWRQGRLTNEDDQNRDFLYLHFMRWRSPRCAGPGEGVWIGRNIVQTDWRRAAVEGFCISPEGFTQIDVGNVNLRSTQ